MEHQVGIPSAGSHRLLIPRLPIEVSNHLVPLPQVREQQEVDRSRDTSGVLIEIPHLPRVGPYIQKDPIFVGGQLGIGRKMEVVLARAKRVENREVMTGNFAAHDGLSQGIEVSPPLPQQAEEDFRMAPRPDRARLLHHRSAGQLAGAVQHPHTIRITVVETGYGEIQRFETRIVGIQDAAHIRSGAAGVPVSVPDLVLGTLPEGPIVPERLA